MQQQQPLHPRVDPFNCRRRDPLGEGFFPHFVGGLFNLKCFLFSPFPALPPNVVRRLHLHGPRTTAANHNGRVPRPGCRVPGAGGLLGPSWGRLGALLGRLGTDLGPFGGPSWGLSWALLGLPSRTIFVALCTGPFEAILGPLGAVLGWLGALLPRRRPQDAPRWPQDGPKSAENDTWKVPRIGVRPTGRKVELTHGRSAKNA